MGILDLINQNDIKKEFNLDMAVEQVRNFHLYWGLLFNFHGKWPIEESEYTKILKLTENYLSENQILEKIAEKKRELETDSNYSHISIFSESEDWEWEIFRKENKELHKGYNLENFRHAKETKNNILTELCILGSLYGVFMLTTIF